MHIALLLAVLGVADPAVVDTPKSAVLAPATTPAAVQLVAPEQRLAAIDGYFADEAPAGQAFFWAWTAAYVALTAVQAGLAIHFAQTGDSIHRNSMLTGAIISGLGLLGHVVLPFGPAFSSWRLRGSTLAGAERLAFAEQRLERDAEGVTFLRSWLPHVAGAVVGLAGGLVLWLAGKDFVNGIITLVATVAVNEVHIWTAPTRAIDNAEDYRHRTETPKLSLLAFPGGGGLKLIW